MGNRRIYIKFPARVGDMNALYHEYILPLIISVMEAASLAVKHGTKRASYFKLLSRLRPPLWSSGQSFWLLIQRPRFDSRHYYNF
jgi:hypothetical protein